MPEDKEKIDRLSKDEARLQIREHEFLLKQWEGFVESDESLVRSEKSQTLISSIIFYGILFAIFSSLVVHFDPPLKLLIPAILVVVVIYVLLGMKYTVSKTELEERLEQSIRGVQQIEETLQYFYKKHGR